MRGYERDEYEDLDEYEEDGEEEEEEYEDDGEDGYEETPELTQEQLHYLGLREKLKESVRKRMKKELGTASSGSRINTNGFRKDDYGSFFGPSQPVIAQRVIQESKSLLENPNLAARISKPNHANNKGSSSAPAKSKAQTNYRPKPLNGLKKNVEVRKNTRDYSFLLSDDAEVPSSTKSPPPSFVSAPQSDARNKHVANDRGRVLANGHDRGKEVSNGHDRGREVANDHYRGREVANGHYRGREVVNSHDRRREANGLDRGREANGLDRRREANGLDRRREADGHDRRKESDGHGRGREVNGHDRRREGNVRDGRKQMPASSQSRPTSGPEKVGPSSKLPIDSRKQLGSNNGSGPGRPLMSKGSLPSKSPISATGRVAPAIARNTMSKPHSQMQSGLRKPTPSNLQSGVNRPTSLQGKSSVQRRDLQESSKPKPVTKQALSSSRDQLRQPHPKTAARGTLADERPKASYKRRRPDESPDGDEAIRMIRQMFGYNPNRFQNVDDDVSDMEADFDSIQREEKRSARIARQEDEEQARLIEEEERREKMRLAKKRKMGH